MILLEAIFVMLTGLLLIPVLIFAFQILAAFPSRDRDSDNRPAIVPNPIVYDSIARPSIAVLVPAHNEDSGIANTLNALRPQLQTGDRLLVVADNCADNTAAVAIACGAEVIERHDMNLIGKGYALDYGLRHLESAPTDVVIVVDADCMVNTNALSLLAHQCVEQNKPVQALYLMHSPPGAGLKTRVAEFAWRVKNWARPLGYHRLGLPCHLMGTGMAFPWQIIQQANLASGHIVEDLKLGLDLAEAGFAPEFCPEAVVTSVFPVNNEGVQSQRTRWEHGHIAMMFQYGPRQLVKSLNTMNIGSLALVLDMFVPPLALLTLLVVGLSLLGGMSWWATGYKWPWTLAFINLAVLAVVVMLAWSAVGRSVLRFSQLAYAPIYALSKVPLYLRFIVRRQVEWVRSKRDISRPMDGS